MQHSRAVGPLPDCRARVTSTGFPAPPPLSPASVGTEFLIMKVWLPLFEAPCASAVCNMQRHRVGGQDWTLRAQVPDQL